MGGAFMVNYARDRQFTGLTRLADESCLKEFTKSRTLENTLHNVRKNLWAEIREVTVVKE